MLTHLVEAFVAFFVIVDPFGTIPLFLSLTTHRTAAEQRWIAIKATIVAASILVFFVAVGQLIFDHLGVNLHAFKVAGGCVLLIVGFQMVMGTTGDDDATGPAHKDIAIFPLGMPYIAGPGTIMTVILQTDNDLYSVYEQVMVTLVLLGVLVINMVLLWFAPVLHRILGKAGNDVLTRVFGLIVATIAMQSILSGIAGFFHIKIG